MKQLDLFGEEFIKVCRDRSFKEYLMLKSGDLKSEQAKYIYDLIASFSSSDKAKIDKIVTEVINRVVHNCMRLFDESKGFAISEKNKVDPGDDLAYLSDGLAGELYGENGWISKYSEFPED